MVIKLEFSYSYEMVYDVILLMVMIYGVTNE
jgi:hypothetical protein